MLNRTKFCEIDTKIIFENSGFLTTKNNLDFLQTLDTFNAHHSHSKLDYITLNFSSNEEFQSSELEKNIGFVLWEKPENCCVLRIKAIVSIADDEFIYSLQAVDDVFELKRSEVQWKQLGIEKYSRFLFIGKHLEVSLLRRFLK